jgi:hypothetical protein
VRKKNTFFLLSFFQQQRSAGAQFLSEDKQTKRSEGCRFCADGEVEEEGGN